MKNNILKIASLTIVMIVLHACGGGSDGPGEPAKNRNPSVPTLSDPTNSLLCTDNNLTFTWNASSDADGDPITYALEVATDNAFTQIVHNFSNLSTTSKTILLEKGLAHYWRVKAKDNNGGSSSYSSTFQLYTEGDGEVTYLPYAPVLVSPSMDAMVTGTSATLSWNASHVDDNAVLSYNVILDTNSSPTTEVASDISETTYSATLSASTTYYWKVVVKDDNGGVTHGQVWTFETE